MNNIIKRTWNQNSMVIIEDLRGLAFQEEANGHTFEISGVDQSGQAVALSGTPSGVMLRSDNQDVALTCSVSDGKVYATLPANAYAVPGRFGLTIFLTSDSQTMAIYAAVGTVKKTSSGTVAPPAGSDVVDLVNAIAAAVATIPSSYTDMMAAMAPTYSNTALYAVGQYAWYEGVLKRCIVPITTAESYTAAHWTNANLGGDVTDLKSAINNKVFKQADITIYDADVSTYNDFNNLDPRLTYSIHVSSGAAIAHTPYGDSVPSMYGIIFNATNGANKVQIYYSYNGEAYYRVYHNGTWFDWYNLSSKKLENIAFMSADVQIGNNDVSTYNDFNNLNPRKTYGLNVGSAYSTSISHNPYGSLAHGMFGIVFCASHGSGWVQCYFSYDGDVYYRKYHNGTWYDWYNIAGKQFSSADITIDNNNVSTYNDFNNLNKLKTYGVHLSSGASIAHTPYGDSVPAMYGLVFSASHGNGYLQCYYSYNGEAYYRIYHNGSWWDWYRISNTENSYDYTNALTGKKWYACGDSFTHGAFDGIAEGTVTTLQSGKYSGQNCVYPFYIGNRNGVDVVNLAQNGMTLGTRSNSSTNNTFGAIYQTIPSDADYVTLYFGINDSGNCTLGTINDNDLTTFYGAWNTIINWLLTNRPKAHIGIFISNSVPNAAYIQATKEIAAKWGIPALDMNSTDHMLVVNSKNPDVSDSVKAIADGKFRVSQDNHHPNPLCHEMQSYFIEQWLLRL